MADTRLTFVDTAKADSKPNPKKIGFGAVTLLMVVVILISLGSQLRAPWPLSLQYEAPAKIGFFETGSGNQADSGQEVSQDYSQLRAVVVDQQYSRLSVIDSEGYVQSIEELEGGSINGTRYSTVTATSTGYYYATSTSFSDSAYLASEQVYFCSGITKSPQLVYERTYSESDKVFNPLFFNIVEMSDGSDVYLACSSAAKSEIEIVSLVAHPGQTVATRASSNEVGTLLTAAYSEHSDLVSLVTRSGDLFVSNAAGEVTRLDFPELCVFCSCAWDNKGLLYCIDAVDGSVVCIDPQTGEQLCRMNDRVYTCLGASPRAEYIACGTESGLVAFAAADFSQGMQQEQAPEPVYQSEDAMPYSLPLSAWTIIVWVAMAYLITCAAIVLVRLVRRMIQNGQRDTILIAALASVSVIAIIAVSIFYTKQFYSFAEQNRADYIGGLCQSSVKDVHAVRQSDIFDDVDVEALSNEEKRALIDALGVALSEQGSSFADFNVSLRTEAAISVGTATIVLSADADGYSVKSFVTDSARRNQLYSEDVNALRASPDRTICGKEVDVRSEYLTAMQGIFSPTGDLVGVVKVYSEIDDLYTSYRDLCVNMMMTLIAVAGMLVLVFVEGKAAVEAWRRRQQEKLKAGGHPEAWNTRQLNFWISMAWSFDATLSVLVASEMLAVHGVEGVDALVGLPTMLSALGAFVGYALFGALASRISGRTLSTMGALGTIAFFALSSLAVGMNAFWAFCAFRFFGTLFLALPDSIALALPLRMRDEKVRAGLFRDFTMASISGAALGGIACGYIAEYLGNDVIYLACIVPSALVLLISICGLPARSLFVGEERADEESAAEKSSVKTISSLRLMFTPAVLALLVCIMFPVVLADGYKSILFPLFMSDAGLPKTYINNIIVFADIAVFAISPQISKVVDDADQWLVVVLSLLFGAATLLWFLVNATMAWSVLALVLLGLMYRMCSPGVSLLLPREARAHGVSETKANNTFSMASSLVSSIPSPVLSSLAALGQSIACAIVGVVCAAGAVIFALVTGRSALRVGAEDASRDDGGKSLSEQPLPE